MFVLAVPWILLLLFLFVVISLLKKKWMLGLLGVLFCSFINWKNECIPFNILLNDNDHRGTFLKILSFNVDGLSEDVEARIPKILDALIKEAPDIVFIAEFPEWHFNALDTLLKPHFAYSAGNRGHAHYFIVNTRWKSKTY